MMGRTVGPRTDVVILGASSGIGRATALAFAGEGARMALLARSADSLDVVAEECLALGASDVLTIPTDITDAEAMAEAVGAVTESFGGVDVWVGASSVYSLGLFEDVPPPLWRRLIEVNLLAHMEAMRLAIPLLRRRKGTAILIGSVFSEVGSPFVAPYVASKHGLIGFAKSLRLELRGQVQICMVLPATIDTPIYQHSANFTGRRIRPLPPAVAPERVAAAILSLAKRPRARKVVGRLQGVAAVVRPVAPRMVDRMMDRYMRKVGIDDESAPNTAGTLLEPAPETNAVSGGWREAGTATSSTKGISDS